MLNITNNNENCGEKIGTISVSIYKNTETGFSAFNINADDDVEHFSYAIEDTMKKFQTSFAQSFYFFFFNILYFFFVYFSIYV